MLLAVVFGAAYRLAHGAGFSMATQPLGSSLAVLGRQAGMRILFADDLVQGRRSSGLRGEMGVEVALG